MDFGLKGKVALAAASSAGIGRAIARALASGGMDLVICSRTESALVKVKEELEERAQTLIDGYMIDGDAKISLLRF